MTETAAPRTTAHTWTLGPSADPLDQLVHLSNLIGRETRLVQPGGGNTSIKIESPDAARRSVPTLLVKGSGTDLESVTRSGFSRLSLEGLAALRTATSMSDAEMMHFMAECMLGREGPLPSVETPLHSLLPYRVIAHTHDVATMSLTNLDDNVAQRLVGEVFEGEIVYAPYMRPGFPLARAVSQLLGSIPDTAQGMTLAHHGLVIWADDARTCHQRLLQMVGRIEQYLETARRGRLRFGPARRTAAPLATREQAAETVLPVIRGALGSTDGVILHLDQSDDVLEALAGEKTPEVISRGVATPEHILRTGRRALWLDLDLGGTAEQLAAAARLQLDTQRAEYEGYHRRNAADGNAPITDWAKVVLVPGLGMVTAFKDKRGARTANLCYRATLEAMGNAESLGGFSSIPEKDAFEFEHWPLERRKIEEDMAREQRELVVPRQIVVVIGGGSGIGQAAAVRFAEEGAHVVVADLDPAAADSVAAEINARFKGRAIGTAVDVRSDESLSAMYRRTVLEFGGLDCLFYTAGLPPRFAQITALSREDLQRQIDVHYLGAVMAIAGAARIMKRQGLGGSIVASVSKAALAPGKDAAAYGGSKAAMMQALRVAAVELGADQIRVNALNADQIETPLFLRFVQERAAARGISVEEQLEVYRKRNLMGASLIPARIVADLAVELASEKFRYTTGDILTIDGGLPDAFPR